MGSIHKTPYFFQPKPLFGLDIGKSSLKIVQLSLEKPGKPALQAYGTAAFDGSAIEDGVVLKPEIIAQAAQELIKKDMIGHLTSRRVGLTIPSYRTFTRSMQLPPLKTRELAEAIRLEAEQYIPLSLDELYLDYTVLSSDSSGIEALVVAVPKQIVDSYLDLSAIMGLEAVVIEPTMSANARLFSRDDQSDVASIIIDFGTVTSDVSIYDKGIVTTGTVEGGGQIFNQTIEKALGVTTAEASIIKAKYGLGKSRRQAEIRAAMEPVLQKIITEIKRLMRYYQEHTDDDRPIQQVVTLGGGANMPGMTDYFTNELHLAVRAIDPWKDINTSHMQLPATQDHPMFTSSIGVALVPPPETFR